MLAQRIENLLRNKEVGIIALFSGILHGPYEPDMIHILKHVSFTFDQIRALITQMDYY